MGCFVNVGHIIQFTLLIVINNLLKDSDRFMMSVVRFYVFE